MQRAAGEPGEERTSARMLGAAPHGSLGARVPAERGPLGLGCLLEEEAKGYGPACGTARLPSRSGAAKWRCRGGATDAGRRCGLHLSVSMLHAQGPCIYADGAGPGWPMSRLAGRGDAGPGAGGAGGAGLGVEIGWSQRGERGRPAFGWRVRCSPGGSSPGVRPARSPPWPGGQEPAVAAAAAARRLHNRAAGRARSPRAALGRQPAASGGPGSARLPGASACQPGRKSFWSGVGSLRLPGWGAGDVAKCTPGGRFTWGSERGPGEPVGVVAWSLAAPGNELQRARRQPPSLVRSQRSAGSVGLWVVRERAGSAWLALEAGLPCPRPQAPFLFAHPEPCAKMRTCSLGCPPAPPPPYRVHPRPALGPMHAGNL
ncbi:spidroin-2-like [Canis lupus familiaris]|uniref:spidroin-2-like n=1 Tax=Canis lupus familiaris TaxID=9615 RepID=UPI0018F64ADF|nr:spidroin-2-like [Canis lupus familiaris]